MGPRVIGVIVLVAALIGIGVYAGVQLSSDDGSSAGGGPQPGSQRPPVVEVPTSRAPATTTTSSGPPPPVTSVRVQAVEVARLAAPVDLTTRPGDDALYVAEKGGRVMAVRSGQTPTVVLDITPEVSTATEQGLLGIEFTGDGSFLYADYTDVQGATRVVEWTMRGSVADPATRRDVLKVDQPFANHNGGAIEFGPDGFLYISIGDGGSAGDPDGNAQNLGSLLGKILRIHPRPTESSPYAVPSSNPFLGKAGARGEIWAYGLRNPWRISFDRLTGDLWIGDVGQGSVEEIDFQTSRSPGGQNYGWDRLEGTRPFEGNPPEEHVPPIFEYARSGGNCAVTGGVVYRGESIGGLFGAYLFADYCGGKVFALRQTDGVTTDSGPLGVSVPSIVSFGQDGDGEVYVLSIEGGVFRLEPAA